jgi:hypothetical protein
MKKDNLLISSSFEITGNIYSRTFNAGFNIVNEPINPVIIKEGEKTSALNGTITKHTGFFYDIVPNAKVVAFKKGIVYDYTFTDENGFYFLYLENGVYDIRIEGQTYNRTIRDYKVIDGIKEYRTNIVNGQIKKRIYDSIEFANYDENGFYLIDNGERLINGIILDEHNKPFEGAEIVVAKVDEINNNREIVAFVKTNKNGEYRFKLSRENYDIIIRSPKHNAKIVRNYLFDPDKGFMEQVIKNSLMFRKGGEWLWTSK